MKHLLTITFLLACIGLGGCVTTQEMATTDASMEWRLKVLEEKFLTFREEQRALADSQQMSEEAIETRVTALEAELVELENATLNPPDDKEWISDLPDEDKTAESAEEKPWMIPPTAETPISPTENSTTTEVTEKTEATPETPVQQVSVELPTTPAPVIPEPKILTSKKVKKPVVASGAKALYDSAYKQYNANAYDNARKLFDTFIAKYPKQKLIPNALYWKGETYYSQKNYAQAILTFKKVTTKYPKHSKAAAAMLKIAMSYEKSGDTDNAAFYLRALIEDFPKSSPAKLGRKQLAKING